MDVFQLVYPIIFSAGALLGVIVTWYVNTRNKSVDTQKKELEIESLELELEKKKAELAEQSSIILPTPQQTHLYGGGTSSGELTDEITKENADDFSSETVEVLEYDNSKAEAFKTLDQISPFYIRMYYNENISSQNITI